MTNSPDDRPVSFIFRHMRIRLIPVLGMLQSESSGIGHDKRKVYAVFSFCFCSSITGFDFAQYENQKNYQLQKVL